MKTSFLIQLLCCGPLLLAQQPSSVTSVEAGVKLEVFFSPTYQTTKDVHLEISMQNDAPRTIQLFKATPSTYDTQIELTDPSGEKLVLNSELPGSLHHRVRKLNLITLDATNSSVKEIVNLSHDYALKTAGTYQCRITKKFYIPDPRITRNSATDSPGEAISIASPLFSFEVKDVDSQYAAKLQVDAENRMQLIKEMNESSISTQPNALKAPGIAQTTTGETKSSKREKEAPSSSAEPTSSMPWSIIVVLIVAAAFGLLWLLLKRRS